MEGLGAAQLLAAGVHGDTSAQGTAVRRADVGQDASQSFVHDSDRSLELGSGQSDHGSCATLCNRATDHRRLRRD
ncbi:MAG: hypothetical protein JWN70_4489 [Planctomycetaceae bacterium]|nr:hypothetical protein [Planctomycetaceae bacterium]